MENWFLSEKEKNYDIESLIQSTDSFFDTVASLLKTKDEKIINKVCTKLTNLFKDKEVRFQNIIINCIPVLLKYYFLHFYEEKIGSCIEACILTIYNLSLTDENVKLNRIRIPNLSLASIYHSPQISSIQSELSESAISKLESEYVIFEKQFKPLLDTINIDKRFSLVRFLILLYYSRLSVAISMASKSFFCEMCLTLAKFNRSTCKIQPIYLNSIILNEMLYVLFYLFNNKLEIESLRAIDAIKEKAENELLVDTLLMSNSIKNLIKETKKDVIIQTSSNTTTSPDVTVAKSQSFIRKKSNDINSPLNINLNFKPLVSKESSSDLESISSNATKQNQSVNNSLTDVYQSPSGELRSEARRASIKLQQQQQQTQINNLNKGIEQIDLDLNSNNSSHKLSESNDISNLAGKIPPLAHIDSINSIPNMDNEFDDADSNYSEKL